MAKARGGTGRHEATCHPRLGGACEAMGLVRKGQAGVAGAALTRDGKAGAMPPGTQPDQELIPAGQGAPPQNPPTAEAGGKSP